MRTFHETAERPDTESAATAVALCYQVITGATFEELCAKARARFEGSAWREYGDYQCHTGGGHYLHVQAVVTRAALSFDWRRAALQACRRTEKQRMNGNIGSMFCETVSDLIGRGWLLDGMPQVSWDTTLGRFQVEQRLARFME